MALDLAILTDTGEPGTTVPISVSQHARLLALMDDSLLPLISRLRDYYEDAVYEASELDSLVAELTAAAEQVHGDEELSSLIGKLLNLVTSAQRLGKPVVAIAD